MRPPAVRAGAALLALALALGACGTEVQRLPGAECYLALRLHTPPYQDTFAGVATLRLTVRLPDGQLIVQSVDSTSSEFTTLGSPATGVSLVLEGLSVDGQQVLARGVSPAFDLRDGSTSEVELLFARTGEFALLLGRLNHARFGHSATLSADGRVLVFGGAGAGELDSPLGLVPPEIYDPAAQASCAAGDCPVLEGADRRTDHTAVGSAGGQVVIVGGRDETGALVDSILVYEPAGGNLRPLTGYDTGRVPARADHSAALVGVDVGGTTREAMLIVGGVVEQAGVEVTTNAGLLFDLAAQTFTRYELPAERARRDARLVPFGTDLQHALLVGGRNDAGLVEAVEVFDGSSWRAPSPVGTGARAALLRPRIHHAALATADGVLVLGGDDGLASLDAPELFTWETERGTGMFELPVETAHGEHRARRGVIGSALAGGQVLYAGGETLDGFERQLLATAELAQPVGGASAISFFGVAPLGTALAFPAQTELAGGLLLLTGGLRDGPDGPMASDEVWIYNPP